MARPSILLICLLLFFLNLHAQEETMPESEWLQKALESKKQTTIP